MPLGRNLPAYIRITDISDDGYYRPNKIVGVDNLQSDSYFLTEGDLVFARTGASVGRSYLYREKDGKLVFAGFLIKISPDSSKLFPEFIFQYVKTSNYWQWVTLMSMRSGQPGIDGNEYGSLPIPIPIPCIGEQYAITSILSDMDMDMDLSKLELQLLKAKSIKQGMMQELLTGRTRLI